MSQEISQVAVRLLAGTGAALGLIASGLSLPAQAVPPPNDTPRTATEITTVPTTIEADTREATIDRATRPCVFGRSVWYRYTPTERGRVKMVTIGSTFDTVLAVYQGVTAPQTLLACNDDIDVALSSAVRPRLLAGQQYWIAVSSCCGGANAPGGDLALRLYRGGTPEVQMTVDSAESGAISGRIRIRGTVACATPSFVYGALTASQRVGDNVARGRGRFQVEECLAEPTAWVARVDSRTGYAFQDGTVAVDGFADSTDGFSWRSVSFETNVPVVEDPLGRIVP